MYSCALLVRAGLQHFSTCCMVQLLPSAHTWLQPKKQRAGLSACGIVGLPA